MAARSHACWGDAAQRALQLVLHAGHVPAFMKAAGKERQGKCAGPLLHGPLAQGQASLKPGAVGDTRAREASTAAWSSSRCAMGPAPQVLGYLVETGLESVLEERRGPPPAGPLPKWLQQPERSHLRVSGGRGCLHRCVHRARRHGLPAADGSRGAAPGGD